MRDLLPETDLPVDRRGRIERWEAEREAAEETIFQRVAEGETLKAVCRSRGWPYSMVARWVGETPEVAKSYAFALALWSDSLAVETVGLADDVDPSEVHKAKVQIDVRMKLASRLHRERYGESISVKGEVEHRHSLIGLLAGLHEAEDAEVLEHEPVPALKAPLPSADHEII